MTRLLQWWAAARGDLDAETLKHFNDWHLASGAQLSPGALAALVAAAVLALGLSAVTLLRTRRPGDVVNLETDILAKYVEKLLAGAPATPALSVERLLDMGY